MMTLISPVEPTIAIGSLLYRHIGLPYAGSCHGADWPAQVLATTALYQKVQLLRQGQVDFRSAPPGLSEADLVLLYGCHYLQAQLAAGCYALLQWERLAGYRPLNGDDAVLDLGCGPFTFGLAILAHQLRRDRGLAALHYVGIDQAPAMLRKAEALAQDVQMLYPDSQFRFQRQSFQQPWPSLELLAGWTGAGRLIINCAQLLQSPSVNVSLLWQGLRALLAEHQSREWVFLYQGPKVPQLQQKWQCLRQWLLEFDANWQTEAVVARIPYRAYDLRQPERTRLSLRPPLTVVSEVLYRQP